MSHERIRICGPITLNPVTVLIIAMLAAGMIFSALFALVLL